MPAATTCQPQRPNQEQRGKCERRGGQRRHDHQRWAIHKDRATAAQRERIAAGQAISGQCGDADTQLFVGDRQVAIGHISLDGGSAAGAVAARDRQHTAVDSLRCAERAAAATLQGDRLRAVTRCVGNDGGVEHTINTGEWAVDGGNTATGGGIVVGINEHADGGGRGKRWRDREAQRCDGRDRKQLCSLPPAATTATTAITLLPCFRRC